MRATSIIAPSTTLHAVTFYGSMHFSLIHPHLQILFEILFLAEWDSLSVVKARVGAEKPTLNCMTRSTWRHKRTSQCALRNYEREIPWTRVYHISSELLICTHVLLRHYETSIINHERFPLRTDEHITRHLKTVQDRNPLILYKT